MLTTTEALEGLAPEWEQLWRADPRATPFHAPQWLLPWWRHVGKGTLLALALRDEEGTLVGLAPLYVHCNPASGRRHLFPLGIATTDYLGPLARPGWEAAMVQALAGHLQAHADAWDLFECPQLCADAPWLALEAPAGWRRDVVPAEPHPVLRLAPGAIPRSTLANVRTCRNRAKRLGVLACEIATTEDLPAWLAALERLHTRRWNERGLPGVLADEAVRAAHAEAAPLLHAAGVLRLHGLRLEGELVAVLYALSDGRRCCYYLGGFEPRHAFLSPGSILLAHAIAQAEAEGCEVFDFLRGAEAYKYRWGAVDRPMVTLRITR